MVNKNKKDLMILVPTAKQSYHLSQTDQMTVMFESLTIP